MPVSGCTLPHIPWCCHPWQAKQKGLPPSPRPHPSHQADVHSSGGSWGGWNSLLEDQSEKSETQRSYGSLTRPMRVNSVGFKSMMTRRGKSLFFPTLHPAAGLAPGKCKYSLFSWDLLKELAFLRVREAIHIRCKRRSKFWPWHAEPPFTNTPEVRLHLRTRFWCWSLASTITSLLSSLCPSYRSLWVVSCPLF